MERSANSAITRGQPARGASPDSFVGWLGGLFAGSRPAPADLSEREMRQIRAKQIDAITRLVPITMTINLVNAAIILFVFRDSGSNIFLGAWALTIMATA